MRRALVIVVLCSCSGNIGGGTGGGGEAGGGSSGNAGGSAGGSSGGSSGGTAGATAGGTAGSTAGGSGGSSGGTGGGTAGGATAGGSGGGTVTDAGTCTALFCDDFEKYDAGRAPTTPWTTSMNSGTVLIDTARAHGGAKSVHVTNNGTAAYESAYFAVRQAFFPVAGNAFYGRAWFYVTAVPPMTTHWTNIQGEGPVPDAGTNVRASVRYGGQVMKHIMANYDTSGVGSDCWQHSNTEMPAGSWNCYEWHYDQPNNRMELWVDGVQLTQVTVNGTGMGCITNGLGGKWLLPQFDTLRLGWEHYQTSIPIDMWVDDVALGTTRIGCN